MSWFILKGIDLISQLICEYGSSVVLSYMGYIQVNIIWFKAILTKKYLNSFLFKHTAEQSVRHLLKDLCSRSEEKSSCDGFFKFKDQEFMDDGSNIDLKVTINKNDVRKSYLTCYIEIDRYEFST